jgi:hypothetical protein
MLKDRFCQIKEAPFRKELPIADRQLPIDVLPPFQWQLAIRNWQLMREIIRESTTSSSA